jgi:hypothetical protein
VIVRENIDYYAEKNKYKNGYVEKGHEVPSDSKGTSSQAIA